MLEELANRLKTLVGRCIISAVKKDGGEWLADGEFLEGEIRRGVEFLQQYGFTSRPKGDVSGVALFVGGSRENGVIVGSRGEDSDMTADLEEGEVLMHAPFGQQILLKKDGSIYILPASGKSVKVDGDLDVAGNITAEQEVTAMALTPATQVTLSKHTHNSAVGPTTPPTPGA